jgi:hypothetical protein
MAQSLPVAHLIVVSIAIYMVNSHLAVIFRQESAPLTVVFLVCHPWALYVSLSSDVLAVTAVVLTL